MWTFSAIFKHISKSLNNQPKGKNSPNQVTLLGDDIEHRFNKSIWNRRDAQRARNWTRVKQGCQMVYFQTKIPIWVNFEGSCNGRHWYILLPFGLFYGHWVYFVVFWYMLPPFWYVVWYVVPENLATLVWKAIRGMQKFSDKFLLTAGSSFFNRKAFVCQQEWERKLEKRKKEFRLKMNFVIFLPFW
jgi:hypothetical protein